MSDYVVTAFKWGREMLFTEPVVFAGLLGDTVVTLQKCNLTQFNFPLEFSLKAEKCNLKNGIISFPSFLQL